MRRRCSRLRPFRPAVAVTFRPGLLALIALASIFSAAQNSTRIHGIVLNEVTREPITHALVASQDHRFAGFTDDQGRFSFTDQPSSEGENDSRYVMNAFSATKPGFLEEGGRSVWRNRSSQDDRDLVLMLTPESLITGKVTVPSSGSFDVATVQLYRRQIADGRPRWLPAGSARARSNGEFRFANLRAGTYKLFTTELLDRDPLTYDANGQQFGYPPAYYPAATDFSSATPIHLAAGQTFEVELTPMRQAYYPVKIRIPDSQGAGVNVTVAPVGHYGPGFSLGFNPGSQSIEGLLPNGTYTVEAIRYGNEPASGAVSITVRHAPAQNATLVMVPGGTIPVNLKEENVASSKSPPHYAVPRMTLSVNLIPADDFSPMPGAYLRQRTSLQDTSLAVTGALPGRYWVRVDDANYYAASISSAGIDLLSNPLVVAPGGSSAPIDVVARNDFAEVNGTVDLDSSDNAVPPENLAVYCVPLPDSPGRFTQANVQSSAGAPTFQCPSLPPGGYRVLAFDQYKPDLEYYNPEAMRAYESKSIVVHLAGNQKENVHVPLTRE